MSVSTFDELYVNELRDLYSAERQLIEALPKVSKKATSTKLSDAVEKHLKQTTTQLTRLEQIFSELGEKPTGHMCKAMQGLITEGKEIMEEVEEGPVLDAALIGIAQKIEHYEIAGYGTARTFAEMLGQKEHIKLLQTTLDEEAATDVALTELALSSVNPKAAKEVETSGDNRTRDNEPVKAR